MNIDNVIRNAYIYNKKVGRDKIYICTDIHDTIAMANYADEMPDVIETAMDALRKLNEFPEIVLILFSSSYHHDEYIEHFRKYGVNFTYFNENPEICDSKTGDFSKKFFYNVLLDDKAGFELRDWEVVVNAVIKYRKIFEQSEETNPLLEDYVIGYQFTKTSKGRVEQIGPFMNRDKIVNIRDHMIGENMRKNSIYREYVQLIQYKESEIRLECVGDIGRHDSIMRQWREFLLSSRPEFKSMDSELDEFSEISEIKVYL